VDSGVTMNLLLDGVLVGLFLWVARAMLSSLDLFRSIVLFIAFGMLMAIAWTRLGAPDVGLAEAAIGAGLTGALLIVTWEALPRASKDTQAVADDETQDEP